MLRVEVMVETKNLSRNISRNIPFRAGNQLLEIYIRGLEILILANAQVWYASTRYFSHMAGLLSSVLLFCDGTCSKHASWDEHRKSDHMHRCLIYA